MEKRLKITSWILIGMLLLPLFQQTTRLFHERKLKGAFTQSPVPVLSGDRWMDGTYQDSLERALNDRFGFRNMFIRINNQVAFSLYRKALASGVVIGKKNYLYEMNYIRARNGEDYIGDSAVAYKAQKLKEIQDYFGARDKHFVVAFAAGKGSFYPEFFPDRYRKQSLSASNPNSKEIATPEQSKSNRDASDGQAGREQLKNDAPEAERYADGYDPPFRTNLCEYRKQFDSLGVNYIDFNKWFLEMKDTSHYCLYPRTGIHWSYYGMVLAIDSLNNYLAEVAGREMPHFEYGEIELSRNYRSSDRDIEDGMNIIFRINCDRMAYPKVQFVDKDMKKLKGVVIADSFFWGLHNIGFSSRIFENGEFWYYNKRIIANHLKKPIELDTIDRIERLKDADVIILMATEATLPKFPFGLEDDSELVW
jgi:hypothetical protein